MAFKDNLKRILEEQGKKLTPFLVGLGYSPSKATAINQGQIPTEKILSQMANELGCSVADFFADDETAESAKKEPASQMTGGLSDLQIQLINMILQMSEPEAAVLLAALSAQKGLHRPLDA